MRAAERAELEAMRDFFAAGGVPTRSAGDALALRAPGPPTREMTRILGLYDLAELDRLEQFYEGGRFWISLDPEAGLDSELEQRGFTANDAWQKFERGVEPHPAATALRIGEADDRLGRVFAEAYGLSPSTFATGWISAVVGRDGWHAFAAFDGDEPVATGALYAVDDSGWLGLAGTLPSHRGCGAQSAILAARIDRARELGLRRLVTETGTPRDGIPGPSYRNIVRSGFEPVYLRPNYAAPA